MRDLYGDLYGEGAGHECQGFAINLNTLNTSRIRVLSELQHASLATPDLQHQVHDTKTSTQDVCYPEWDANECYG